MESAANAIVSHGGQLVWQEIRLLRSVGGEVTELRDELATMNALLRMQTEAEDGAVDHFIREWMKQLRELAYDAEDVVDLYIFRIRKRSSDGLLVKSKRLLATLFPRHLLAGDIKALRARAIAISERHARCGVSREALRPSPSFASVPAAPESALALRPFDDPDQLVGILEQAKLLVDKMEARDDTVGNNLKVFSIVGFGGLGKTTLAMEVCRLLETKFDRQAKVSVSQVFDGTKDVERLLKSVLLQTGKVNPENRRGAAEEKITGMSVEELAEELKKSLEDKRYLIVIDDVWTMSAWTQIRSKLPNNIHGSRIIVTTRTNSLAKDCVLLGDDIHHMKPLSLEDSKKLFISRAFGPKETSCPEELKGAMDDILKKCDGLPLAIVSIGSLLASYNSPECRDIRQKICTSIGSQMESHPTLEGMRKIITFSFNYLPYDLKRCMMYLGIFPEDYPISKNRLLSRWIAEGLIPEKRGFTLMDTAEAYFNELVNRSMIDQAGRVVSYYDRVDMCRVHDMLLDVMVSKSLEANFVSLVGIQHGGISYDIIRRLSIHGREQEARYYPSKKGASECERVNVIEGMNVQHVRSLTTFQSEGNMSLLDQLGKFKLLRVLDLEDCKDLKNQHMRYICKMYLLRFLSLRRTDITVIPPEVGDLENLQTLDVDQTQLSGLPNSVIKLRKLERLIFSHKAESKWLTLWILPKGISNMKALREVGRVGITDIEVAKEIGHLKQLERIFVYFKGTSDQIEDIREELARSLSKLSSLQWLDVGEKIDYGRNDMGYLLNLDMPPQLLRYLRFGGTISKIPAWVGSLAYLTEFTISCTGLSGDQPFDVLCEAPILKSILFQMSFYIEEKLIARSRHNFPELKNMRVINPTHYPKVFSFEENSMTKLEILELDFGNWQKSIVGMEHLTDLKEVRLTGNSTNTSVAHVADELKTESDRRRKSNQSPITVGVRYY